MKTKRSMQREINELNEKLDEHTRKWTYCERCVTPFFKAVKDLRLKFQNCAVVGIPQDLIDDTLQEIQLYMTKLMFYPTDLHIHLSKISKNLGFLLSDAIILKKLDTCAFDLLLSKYLKFADVYTIKVDEQNFDELYELLALFQNNAHTLALEYVKDEKTEDWVRRLLSNFEDMLDLLDKRFFINTDELYETLVYGWCISSLLVSESQNTAATNLKYILEYIANIPTLGPFGVRSEIGLHIE